MENEFFPTKIFSCATSTETEDVIIFRGKIDDVLFCAANVEYEIYVDGEFFGVGGIRCPYKTVYVDKWEVSGKIELRVHYLNPQTTKVWYRAIFPKSFIAFFGEEEWETYTDSNFMFGEKISSQLPRQNFYVERNELKTFSPERLDYIVGEWKFLMKPVENLIVERVAPKILVEQKNINSEILQNIYSKIFPDEFSGWNLESYDLGKNGLYKVCVDGEAFLVYSEVEKFSEVWSNSSRNKVRMIDYIDGDRLNCHISVRGCRFLHVIFRKKYEMKICRLFYPLSFIPTDDKLLVAAQRTLEANVDGGVVDTSWRERTQWTGDLRMSAKAIRKLTTNGNVVVKFALKQISTSMNFNSGMVQGAWPCVSKDQFSLEMPTYHLLFCLTILESNVEELYPKILQSIEIWKKKYLRGGLIVGVPGWYFIDWDPICSNTSARDQDISVANCAVNCWWQQICNEISEKFSPVTSGLDITLFHKTFRASRGYKLWATDKKESIHATAICIESNFPGVDKSFIKLLKSDEVLEHVSPFCAYFVAGALNRISTVECKKFIKKYYSDTFSTFPERLHSGSLCHTCGLGIIEFLSS